MAVVVDASAILALADRSDPNHGLIADWVDLADDEFVVSPLTAAQADGLLRVAGGTQAGEAFATDLESGAYVVRWWADAMAESAAIVRTQGVDLVDASLIAVAAKASTNRVATTRFEFWRRLSTVGGSNFEVVPPRRHSRPLLLETA